MTASTSTALHQARLLLQRIANGQSNNPAADAQAFLQSCPSSAVLSTSALFSTQANEHADIALQHVLEQGISATTLQVIADEMLRQAAKFGQSHIQQQSLTGHILILQGLVSRAATAWVAGAYEQDSAQAQLVKIAALALHAINNEVARSTQVQQQQLAFDQADMTQ